MSNLKLLILDESTDKKFVIDAVESPRNRELFNYNYDYVYEKFGVGYKLEGVFSSDGADYWIQKHNNK